ncbi:MAG: hypothetical protein HKO03_04725, partial [Acidimicrobiia bacterium]|nr:hypothetical protein [Acidimicrobiia bacterium]
FVAGQFSSDINGNRLFFAIAGVVLAREQWLHALSQRANARGGSYAMRVVPVDGLIAND